MSDIYHVDIQDHVKKCEGVFILLIDKYYTITGGVNVSIIEAEKNNAKNEIRNICRAIEHRIELLLYIKDMLKDFDWSKWHRFEFYKEESKKSTSEEMICQKLQDGKIEINLDIKRVWKISSSLTL